MILNLLKNKKDQFKRKDSSFQIRTQTHRVRRVISPKYKPITIRKLLTEMKDLSELMIDLAYSAALFHDKDLAEEVINLEKHIDILVYQLHMHTMLAARDAEDAEALVSVATVATAVDKFSDAAADIAHLPIQSIEIHSIIRNAFQNVEEHLTKAEIHDNSPFIGKTIGNLQLATKIGVDITAIRREVKWILDPQGDEVLQEGDVVLARGAEWGIQEFEKAAKGKIKSLREHEGGTLSEEITNNITKKLVELKNNSEIMFDLAYSSLLLNSKRLAKEVERLEEHMDDLHTEFEILVLSSGFSQDEAKHSLGLIRLGVVTEEIADAAFQIAEVVLNGLKPHPIIKKVLEEADETVVRAKVNEDSPLVGKTLREAELPKKTGMWILAINRAASWIRPKPDTTIQAGDILITVGYAEGEEDLATFSVKLLH